MSLGWVGLVGWMVFLAVMDRPHRPAWRVRNAYRILCAFLVITWCLLWGKAQAWHTELVSVIQQCR